MSTSSDPGQASPDTNQIPLPIGVMGIIAETRGPKPLMTQQDLKRILEGVETALEVFQKNEGHLRAVDIGLKSMLSVVKARVADELSEDGSSAENHGNAQPTLKFSVSNEAG